MIDCAIVDDHCDIYPFFIAAIRAKKIPLPTNKSNNSIIDDNDVVFVHFDSHPDLSLPSSSVLDWKNQDKMQNILNNEGGIAEFILPLMYNNYINKVLWIKPHWSTQFEDGCYHFTVGNNITHPEAAITLQHPYYYGESIVVNDNNICGETKKSINFIVGTDDIDDNENNVFKYVNKDHQICWCLDLCLDYFSTYNPFIQEIINHLQQDIEKMNLLVVFDDDNILISYDNNFMVNQAKTADNMILIIKNFFHTLRSNTKLKFDDYEDNKKYFDLMKETYHSINNNTGNDFLFEIIHCEHHLHLKNFFELLKFISTDSKAVITKVEFLILLPHHISTMDEIDAILNRLKIFIAETLNRFKSFPKVITIARSSDEDEYTPQNQVNIIQEKLIRVLKETISQDIVVHNLCEDPWNSSYSIFLNDKIKRMINNKRHI